jgi:hypothetical protein
MSQSESSGSDKHAGACVICGAPYTGPLGLGPCENGHSAMEEAAEADAQVQRDKHAALLPCPFCGGQELTIECAPDERRAGPDMPDTPFAYAVFCASNDGDCGTGPTGSTAEEAAASWNRRSAPSAASSSDDIIEWIAGQTKVQHCTPAWCLTDVQIRALKGKFAPSSEGTNDPLTWEYWRDRARKAEAAAIASPSHERSNDPNLLADLSVALDDWLHQYAPEHCDDDQVRTRAKRIFDMGGTLYYLAGLQKRIRAAIEQPSAKLTNEWIEWDGARGVPPIAPDARVDVRFRNGDTVERRRVDNWLWKWQTPPGQYDIAAYKLSRDDGTHQ